MRRRFATFISQDPRGIAAFTPHPLASATDIFFEKPAFARSRGRPSAFGAKYAVDFPPETEIEIVVSDDMVDRVIEIITESAKTGKIGNGKITVSDLEQVVRLRTGKTELARCK